MEQRGRGDNAKPMLELYNLEADIGETNNLAQAHPEVVAGLRALVDAYDAGLKANSRPVWRAAE
jgi:hypothetical protein